MPAFTIDTIVRGNSKQFAFVLKTRNGVPVDITGATFEIVIKLDADDLIPILYKSWNTHFDAVNGSTSVYFTSAEMALLPAGFVYVEATYLPADGRVITVVMGNAPVEEPGRKP